jgi:hypothetical protein
VIDPLWQSGRYKRKTIYIRLKEAFGEEVHVGTSDAQRCKEIIETGEVDFSAMKPKRFDICAAVIAAPAPVQCEAVPSQRRQLG